MTSSRTEIGHEEMRSVVLDALARVPTHYREVLSETGRQLLVRGLIREGEQAQYVPDRLWPLFRDIFSELVSEGVVGVGKNTNNPYWPFLGLTSYGRRCVEESRLLPYDADGYLASLERASLPIDDIETRFIAQALGAQRGNLPDASTVMLGCAAEHLVVRLAEELARWDIGNAKKTEKLLSTGPAKALLDHVSQRFDPAHSGIELPRNLKERRQTVFAAIGDLIRMARNDAGHPSAGQVVDRDYVFVLLRLYHNFRGWIAEVVEYLRANPPPATP